MKQKYIIVIAVIVALIIGFSAGVGYGIQFTIKRALTILPFFANISIDYNAINEALFRYNNNIGGCEPLANISK